MKSVKLATRLEDQLARLFLMASVAVLVVVGLGFYVVTAQTQEAASHFISSHVRSLVSAGVTSQSINEIEREVRRLHSAWTGAQKTFQKSDVRIAVAIDGVRVGQAGPLKSFGWLSRSYSETQRLPSGQVMSLKMETDFSDLALWVGVISLLMGVTFYSGFLYLRHLLSKNIRSLTAPLEERMSWLAEVSLHLPESVRGAILPQNSTVTEVADLDRSLNAFVQQILRLEQRVKEAGINEGRVEVADRVAHALKGKLSVLRLRIDNMQGLTVDDRRRLRESVNGLMMSSKDMLDSGRQSLVRHEVHPIGLPILTLDLVESVVRARNERERLLNRETAREDRIAVSFVGDRAGDLAIDPSVATGFEDAMIAIIDNAIEASTDFIHIQCEVQRGGLRIEVTDFGCGIPADVLPRLFQERATFGKKGGNGLGLFHAAKVVKAIGGRIEIRSKENVGTTILIEIPRVKTESNIELNLDKPVFDTAN